MGMKTIFLLLCSVAAIYSWLALAVPRFRGIARYRSGIPWSPLTIALNGACWTLVAMTALGVAPLLTFLLALACMIAWIGFAVEADRRWFRAQKGENHGR